MDADQLFNKFKKTSKTKDNKSILQGQDNVQDIPKIDYDRLSYSSYLGNSRLLSIDESMEDNVRLSSIAKSVIDDIRRSRHSI